MRHFTNRLFSGASVTTVFHELWHGLWNKAQASGTISRDEALGFVRSVDSVMGEKKMKRGQGQDQALRLLPADFDTLETKDQDTAISEALSHIAEMEVLRTRKRAVGDKSVTSR